MSTKNKYYKKKYIIALYAPDIEMGELCVGVFDSPAEIAYDIYGKYPTKSNIATIYSVIGNAYKKKILGYATMHYNKHSNRMKCDTTTLNYHGETCSIHFIHCF